MKNVFFVTSAHECVNLQKILYNLLANPLFDLQNFTYYLLTSTPIVTFSPLMFHSFELSQAASITNALASSPFLGRPLPLFGSLSFSA